MKIAGIKAPQLRDGIEGDIQRTLRFLAQGQGSFQQFGGLVGDCGRTGTVQLGNVAGGAGDGEEPVKPGTARSPHRPMPSRRGRRRRRES